MTPAKVKSANAWLREKFDLLSHYHEVAEVGEIMRRYFVINAFDGVLTTLGVLAGGYIAGVDRARAVISVIVTTAIGIGVAGFYGSYLVEKAERERARHELEEYTFSSLEDTSIASASTYATIVIAIVDGLSPVIAAAVAMIPFFFTSVISVHAAYFASGVVALVELFLLGIFLGRMSRDRLIVSGAKLVAAGLVALGLSLLLGREVR